MSSNYHFRIKRTRLPADEITPVRLYRQLRTYFSPSVLLESNNFTQARDTHSIIGVDPLIEIEMREGQFTETYFPAARVNRHQLDGEQVFAAFEEAVSKVTYSESPGDIDGFFGFTSFDAYRFAEPEVQNVVGHSTLPDLHYFFFRFLLIFDHFHEHIDIIECIPQEQGSMTERLLQLFKKPLGDAEQFSCVGEESSTLTDEAYEALVSKGKAHCDRGDTFQVVLSRGFEQQFDGDDFNVYRQLRRLNPSPYCFYFDFGRYRMLGASPEALLTVKEGRATMRPIAGTYAVTGDQKIDNESAEKLLADPKENAEHRMLVDLSRNDLSRSCFPVRVDQLRKIEKYSHLMHIVSQVSGAVEGEISPYAIYAQCFPAGTLSGAPKFKAVELIYEYEKAARGAYGGGLGYVSSRGGFDHCIIIRSAVVIGNTLHFRAGAGIVSASNEVSERKEVTHKTNALRKAIALAQEASKTVAV